MRRRDKIKSYIPYISGGVHFLWLQWFIEKWSVNVEYNILPLTATWLLLTLGSTLVLDYGLKLFDKTYKNSNEEEEE